MQWEDGCLTKRCQSHRLGAASRNAPKTSVNARFLSRRIYALSTGTSSHKLYDCKVKVGHIRSQSLSADDKPWRAGASFVTLRARERARDGGERRSGRGVIGSNYESSFSI